MEPLPVRQSRLLRRRACNNLLIGMLTTIADFESKGEFKAYTTVLRERLNALFDLLEEIETVESIHGEYLSRLEEIWKSFFLTLQPLKSFVADRSPMPEYWRRLHREAVLDLSEHIILVFCPDDDDEVDSAPGIE